jgi:hypothetical protein
MEKNERKTITINPELFKIAGTNKTRKNKEKDPNKAAAKIRVKNAEKTPKISTIKRNILKMIRNHQYDRKKMENNSSSGISNKDKEHEKKTNISSHTSSFNSDFDDSLSFLSSLSSEIEQKKKGQNQTIRQYPSNLGQGQPKINIPERNLQPIGISSPSGSELPYMLQPPKVYLPSPKYGCLKNGALPTYRNWMTQKNFPVNNFPVISNPQQNPIVYSQIQPNQGQSLELEKKIKEMSRIAQMDKKKQIEHQTKEKKFRYPKQKKILRRTFHIGKSKVHPRVSVLVSNKTIRAQTTLKKQQLKNIPIAEVKKYLLKHGFIKVGTSSPNDVLREMYENAKIIGGEIKNHNPENLLYNYFHATESDL